MATEQESWSGGRQAPQIRHRWQRDWSALQNDQFLAPPRRLRRRIFLLFVVFLALFAGFGWALLYTPDKTPLVLIAATEYEWPVPINAWAKEDVDGFASLDATNLNVQDISSAWQTKEHGLGELRRRLEQLRKRRAAQDPVVIYLSMHGAVDGSGEPCLIPPGLANPPSSQWLPVRQVIDVLNESLGNNTPKLLVLDAQRVQVNWRLGIVLNDFVDRIAALVENGKFTNLSILTAASTGEKSWSSRDIQGSVFGKYVRLGLAGAADDAAVGNGDGRVTVHELHQYVRTQTLQWARDNRAARQTPRLIPADSRDVGITWAINRRSLARLIENSDSGSKSNDTVAPEKVAKLWQQFEQIRTADALAYDPVGVHRLEQRLLELEQRSAGGEGYAKSATALYEQLDQNLSEIASRQKELENSASGVGRARVISGNDDQDIYPDALHSLGMCEYFSGLPVNTIGTFRERLLQLATSPDELQLEALLNEFPEKDVLSNLAETQLLRMASRYDVDQHWSSGAPTRAALEARMMAERLSCLLDPRAQQWIQADLAKADAAVRSAEDRLFAGESVATEDWERLRETLNTLRDAPDATPVLTLHALQVGDQAASRLPYLARWFCRPLPAEFSQDQQTEVDQLINGPLLEAISATASLNTLLARESTRENATLPFREQTHVVEESMATLQRTFETTLDQLVDPGKQDHATFREIDEALRVPIIPWAKRLSLLQKQASLSAKLHGSPATSTAVIASDSGPGTTTPLDSSNSTYQERARAWRTHPLLAILQLKTSDEVANDEKSKQKDSALVDESIRQRLSQVSPHSGSNPEDEERPAISVRETLSQRARSARASAALWLPPSVGDPIATLRKFDWQELFLNQCQRSLDDFWGPVQSSAKPGVPEAYFSVVASDYLEAAGLVMPLRGELEQRDSQLRRSLSQRRLSALRGLRISAEAAIQLDNQEGVVVDVTLAQGEASSEASPGVAILPGQATLFAISRRGDVTGPRSTIRLPMESQKVTQRLSGQPRDGAGRAFEAVAFFRGHEFKTPFLTEGIGGIRVDYQPNALRPTRLTVFGDRRKRTSIMFVLDCSSSMGELIPVESIGSSEQPRLDLAKSALAALMEELATRSDARVGVRFYGHRIGWTTTEPVQALAQQDYVGEIPDDLSPSEDVELVLPLGRFDSIEAGKVVRQMESLKAWGQSPSYLALLRCLDDFEKEDGDTDKSVVVITDGANYQFSPANAPQNTAAPTTKQDILSAWEDRDVPVYILGFGVSDEEASQAEREFRQIAKDTGGAYYPVNNGRDLLKALRERLSLGGYSVEDATGAIVSLRDDGEPLVPLNTSVRLPELAGRQEPYTVKFESVEKEVTVEGGESIELYVTENGTDLVSKPFDENFPVAGLMSRRGEPERLIVRLHRPSSDATAVSFPISLQSESYHFTRRPSDVWVEVAPVLDNELATPLVYGFYDTHFESQQPVPLLRWTATNWPPGAREAAVRVWAKFEPTEPVQTITVPELFGNRDTFSALQQVNGMTGVKFRVDIGEAGRELKVVEQHDASSAGIYAMKVKLITPRELRPLRVVHQFDAENGLAIHSFHFAAESAAALAKSSASSLAFFTRESIQQGAFAMDGGALVVPIYGSGDTLPLNAATGPR